MVKRIFDLSISLIILPLLIPLFLLIALMIKISSQGPIFYRGWRVGLHGKLFRIYKFRTMVVDAEKLGGPSAALHDPRFTKWGSFFRKYKIDEFPQLFNVLKGEMSLVGPRPQIEAYTKLYNMEEKQILNVRPGMTDYASIEFINLDQILGDESVDQKYLEEIEPKKNKLRIKYAKENSLLIDIKIVLITFLQLLRIKSIWNTKN